MEYKKVKIPYNKPGFTGKELKYIRRSVKSGNISGDGLFNKKCTDLIKKKFKAKSVFLTPSCSAALDMTALLLKLKKGDEVLVPSFTFTSSVNAFVLQGAKPVFVDIRPDTLNIDEKLLERAITKRTKAIYLTHYAGVSCEMDEIMRIAKKHKLFVVEDAAHAINAKYKDKFLGTIGDFGTYSFHETKNINCGEGGALLVNRAKYIGRAEIIREKGTDRSKFFRGEVDKYTWQDVGSSYLLSDVLSAYLYAQLENVESITAKRKKLYNYYVKRLEKVAREKKIQLPFIPKNCQSNYHIFYLLFQSKTKRNKAMDALKRKGILSVHHYLPLHMSPMGKRFGYQKGQLPVTERVSGSLLRLPLYKDLTMSQAKFICDCLLKVL